MERTLNRIVIAALAVIASATAQTGIIQTIAGGYVGDGGLALQAGLYEVHSVAFDPDGTMYIADKTNNRIRRVTVDGRVTTLAGNSESGFKGDGGPATSASFWQPQAVAVDSQGRIYVADVLNHRVRRIATDGKISTFAGNGTLGGFQFEVPATTTSAGYPKNLLIDKDDVVYVADPSYSRVYKVDSKTNILSAVAGGGATLGDNGPSTSSRVNNPTDIAIDAQGNLFVSESNGNRIRRIDKRGIITTICGDGVAGYNGDNIPAISARINGPQSIVADGGDLYIADFLNHRIRRIRNGIITTVAGNGIPAYSGDGGPAAAAQIGYPLSVRLDPSGNLVISDAGNALIRKIDRATGIIGTVAGTTAANSGDGGPALGSYLRQPSALILGPSGSGSVIFTDSSQNRIRVIDAAGLISTLAGGDDAGTADGDATTARFFMPTAIVSDGKGTYYVSDGGSHRIRKIDPKGNVTTVAGSARGISGDNQPGLKAQFNQPEGLALHPKTGELYISDFNNHCVRKLDSKGIVTVFAGQCGKSGFNGDSGVALGATLNSPHALIFDAAGNLFISDTGNNRIRRVDGSTGAISTFAGTGDTTQSFIDQINLNAGAKPNPPFGNVALKFPFQDIHGFAFDGAGNMFLGQRWFILRIDAVTQAVTPVAGNCLNAQGDAVCYGYTGDGGVATQALTSIINAGVAVDSKGVVYMADGSNGRIRTIGSAAATSPITIRTQPAGLAVLADGRQVNDGDKLNWIPGTPHQLAVAAIQMAPTGNSRYVFTNWSAGTGAGTGQATFTASFKTQYKLDLNVNGNGMVTANPPAADGGFYDASTNVQLSATPLGDAIFAGFSPAADGGITMDGPKSVVASFQASSSDLSVSPGTLKFVVKQGDMPPPSQRVTVAMTGAPLTFGIASSDGYVNVQVQQNTTPAVARVSINPSGLRAGSYTPSLTIDTGGGSAPISIPIDLTVTPGDVRPDMLVSPSVLNVTVAAGTQTSTQFFAVTSAGTALRIGYSVKSGSQWMLVQARQNNSVSPATLDITFSPAGLTPGVYSGRIEVTSGDASDQTATQIVMVNLTVEAVAPAQLLPSVTGLTFQYQQKSGGTAAAPAAQTVAIASSQTSTRFYPSASVLSSAQWLKITTPDKSNSASTPALLAVTVDPSLLAAGASYEGSIDLRLSLNGDLVARVPIRLDIAAPPSTNLITDRTPIQFHQPVGSVATPVVWKIQSPGVDSVAVTVRSADNASWLRLTPGSTTAGDSNPALVQVSADSSGLVPGTYASSLVANAGGTTLTLPVTLTVTANPAALLAVQKSVTITGKAGSIINRNLDLSATSSSPVSWQASSDSDWLRLMNASGTINPNSAGSLTISVDSSKLPVGVDRSGTIQITSPQTSAPEVITVTATAYSANQPPYLDTAGVVFTATAGSSATAPKNVTVTYPNQFGASATLIATDSWIKTSTGSVKTDNTLGQATFGIFADPAGLAPGIYKNFVFVNFNGSTALNLSVVLVVNPAGGNAGLTKTNAAAPSASGCTPKKLIPVFASDIFGLHLRLGDTANTDFVVVDDCGSLLTNGAVSTNFSTSDRPADLSQVQSGVWRSSWVPRLGAGDNGIQFNVAAVSQVAGLPIDRPDIQASISGASNAPLLDYRMPFLSPDQSTQVVVSAPGSRMLINGANLSPATIRSATGTAVLGNTSVTIGGVPMTLMSVSPTQIDALVPAGISTNVMQSIVVSNGGSLSAPERIAIADFWPTVVMAGQARRGGLDIVLTGIGKDTTPDSILIRAGGQDCRISKLQPIKGDPGFYYAHATGCDAAAGQPIETRTRLATVGSGVVRTQAAGAR